MAEVDRWRELDLSGKTDLDIVGSLPDAIFLFALRKIQTAEISDLQAIWRKYQPVWIRILSEEPYYYVKKECARRATENRPCDRTASPTEECKQLTMKEEALHDEDDEPF